MNIEEARVNMIKQQIHTWDVLDETLLHILSTTPRENFVPSEYRNLAFADMPIKLPHQQQMFCPKEEARMLQSLMLKPQDTVLEIGTGSGYVTALLARMAAHVFSVDIFEAFTKAAGTKLAAHHINNVTLITADAALGWQEQAPYDAIAVTGSLPLMPLNLRDDLKIGGRLFCIVGDAPAMTAMIVTRVGRTEWSTQTLFETCTPALINAPTRDKFVF